MGIDYAPLISRSIRKELLSREEAKSILSVPDSDVPELLRASFEVRSHFHGKKVKLCMLQNAQSGLCPEDCHYCSQSSISSADIPKYRLLSQERLFEGARRACEAGAKRYCMVTSGRGPTPQDIDHFRDVTARIKKEFPLEICCCLGILNEKDARTLKESGVGWVNHNLNTSERFYPEVCTTHTYEDRVNTVKNVARSGLSTCSGGIVGMGESDEDIVDLAFAIRSLNVESIPINFLHPIPGTPLEKVSYLAPEKGLKVLCLFRFLNPDKEIRAAGGRELKLGRMQKLALYPANSIFIDGYLTTPGQAVEEAQRMIEEEGFEVEGCDVEMRA